MLNTSKKVARMLASLLVAHGTCRAVLSPGSRNAPLIIALEREEAIDTKVVIDERSAAFIAMGISMASDNSPVALVCTSGTAPLNYAPALAEAYYRHIPLIAITADRPEEWIGQDDSQTIVQPGIFSNFVKGTFDIPVENDDPDRMWMINRKLNDALLLAASGIPGPVHINIRLDEPLGEIIEIEDSFPRVIRAQSPITGNVRQCPELSDDRNIMIICGFMGKNGLSEPLKELARRPNVVILHEAQSNLHGDSSFIPNIDATLSRLPSGIPLPDIVISLGGSLTSRKIKAYIRQLKHIEHWSVGCHDHSVDCFKHLTVRISQDEESTIKEWASQCSQSRIPDSPFKKAWLEASRTGLNDSIVFANDAPWCDFKAMGYVISKIPHNWNVQLSNGTSVRYAQLFDYSSAAAIHCNRGVSGIDGCTSTAIGAAIMSATPTLLITGDMSMQYDIGALACSFIPNNFKIIVLNNGGGGIFRFIPSTRHLEELEKCFVADVRLPLAALAEAYRFKYLHASNMRELETSFDELVNNNASPTILEITTDGCLSAEILSKFLDNKPL